MTFPLIHFHDLFAQQAAALPQHPAVICNEHQLTYGELNARANQIARRLQSLGAGPHLLVGVLLPRSPDLIATVLGVLKAGAAYVPLDPSYPRERLAGMVSDAALTSVIVDAETRASRWPASRVICTAAATSSPFDVAILPSGR